VLPKMTKLKFGIKLLRKMITMIMVEEEMTNL
jgi:hypothetical protein